MRKHAADPGAGFDRRAFELSERSRARTLAEMLAEAKVDLRKELSDEQRRREDDLVGRLTVAQKRLFREGLPAADKSAIQRDIAAAERELELFELQLRRGGSRYASTHYADILGVDRIRGELLAPGTAVLEYALGENGSYVWVISSGGFASAALPKRKDIEDLVDAYRKALSHPVTALTAAGALARLDQQGKQLYQMLVSPVEKALAGQKALIVVPDGILAYLPFEALPGPERVIERFAVTYAPSASTLATIRGRERRKPEMALLAFGDPAYTGRALPSPLAAYAERGLEFTQLPNTRTEVSSIQNLFGPAKSRVYLGAAAKEQSLKTEKLDQYRFVHFATHGYLDEEKPARSGIMLSLESGAGEDGVLQVPEIMRLSLNADLVTLSACQSGVGKILAGEGAMGLSRAFFYAGAQSLVVSLWNIDDAATADLMKLFYRNISRGESRDVALRNAKLPHPTNPNLFYAGSQGALLTRFDRRTGYTRDIQVYPLFFSGESAGSLPERWQWTFPIVFSPLNPDVLYTSSQHLWKTTDDGHSWQKISPDLTRNDPKTLGDSGGPITHDQNGPEIYGTIYTIAPSRKEANTIWTGSDDGVVQITRDGGKTWSKITPPGLPDFGRVSLIEASPHNAGTAYVAVKNYQNDDLKPYIFKTADYGKTWTKIVTGIPERDYVHAVREDPVRQGLLFAGTEHGIYASFNDGAEWQSMALNLPDTQVPDLVIEGKDVVIATHGRSFYVLDDITPLRQLTPTLVTQDVHLFRPPVSQRNVSAARIDYFLKQPVDKITIDILDSKGQVIRSFAGSPEDDRAGGRGGRAGRGGGGGAAPEGEAAPAEGGDEGGGGGGGRGGAPPPVPRKAGINHFQWDGRYPAAKSFAGMIYWSGAQQGPQAVPGTYQVRLTANGKTLTERLVLEKDPRLDSVTVADLTAQFTLAMQVRDKTTEANDMVISIRELKKQIDDRLKKNQDAPLKSSLDAFRSKITAVEEEVYQVRNRSGQDPLNFPIKLNNKLAALQASIERGDGKPTAGSSEVFKVLTDLLAVQKGRLDAALKTDLPAVNKLLAERKLDPLVVTTTETKDPAAPAGGAPPQ